MDGMDFGVLSDMPNIRKKASCKLLRQQVSSSSLHIRFFGPFCFMGTWEEYIDLDSF